MLQIWSPNHNAGGNFPINRIVIHSMEAPEKGDTAENVAHYLSNTSVRASAHYCIDNDSIVQCVKEEDRAWHAPPNPNSIGLEHAGYARQSPAEWKDSFSSAMLELSATFCASLCRKYNVPPVWLSALDLQSGKRGITSHYNVVLAWHKSDHTDPGGGFPSYQYCTRVQQLLGVNTDMIAPQADPPISMKPWVSWTFWYDGKGIIAVSKDGDVYCLGSAPYLGGPGGKSYFSNQIVAKVFRSDDGEAVQLRRASNPANANYQPVPNNYMIRTTSNQWYGPGF
jgi:hypothetical protein